jgi:hypothetical protein
MRGAIPPPLDTPSGRGAQLKKHSDKFTFYFTFTLIMKSRRMSWAGSVACLGGMRNAYKILVGKTKGKRPLRRPRSRWVDTIRMGSMVKVMDWIHLGQDRDRWWAFVNTVMNIRFPKKAENL